MPIPFATCPVMPTPLRWALAAVLCALTAIAAAADVAPAAGAIREALAEAESLSNRDLAASIARAGEAEAAARALGDASLLVDAQLLIADGQLKARRLDEAALVLDQLEAGADRGAVARARIGVLRARWLRDHHRIAEAEDAFTEAAALAERAGDTGLLAIVLNSHAAMLWRQAQTDRSQAMFERALAINRALQRPGEVLKNLSYLSLIARDRGDLDRSLALNDEVLALSEAEGNLRGIAVAANSAGLLLVQQDEIARSIEYFARAAESYRLVGDPTGQGPALSNLAMSQLRLGQLNEASASLQQALKMALSTTDASAEVMARVGLATLALARGDHPTAEAEALASLAAAREQPAPSPGSQTNAVLAAVRAVQQRPQEALEFGRLALEFARTQGRQTLIRERLVTQAGYAEAAGDAVAAVALLREAFELNQKIRDDELRRGIARMEGERQARERELELAARAQRIEALEREAGQQRLIRGLLLGLLVLAAVLAVLQTSRIRFRRRAEQQLRAHSAEIERVNRELAVAADTDALTRAFNRRYFHQQLVPQLRDCMATATPFALALLDADHFKSINDRLGHDAGDAVLVALTHAWNGVLAPGDALVRWGGEEFLLVLHGDQASAAALIDRGLAATRAGSFASADGSVRITVSVGWVAGPVPGSDIDALLHIADLALLRAKQQGRDRALQGFADTLASGAARAREAL
ncbi:diguanylate cyclase domain-containing protein [Aquimonas sp.]|uniref:diguanylate cyclase domain-containing protein n=1 Tax=Aquimonas sp. TaxID=1872588 RepID=UPI0037C192D3